MSCDPLSHCITCSDEGVPMVVRGLDSESGLALCTDAEGNEREVDVSLVTAGAGDQLLVHADVAIARVEPAQ